MIGHTVGAANEARNQILFLTNPFARHGSFQRGVIVAIKSGDNFSGQQERFFFLRAQFVPRALFAFAFGCRFGHGQLLQQLVLSLAKPALN